MDWGRWSPQESLPGWLEPQPARWQRTAVLFVFFFWVCGVRSSSPCRGGRRTFCAGECQGSGLAGLHMLLQGTGHLSSAPGPSPPPPRPLPVMPTHRTSRIVKKSLLQGAQRRAGKLSQFLRATWRWVGAHVTEAHLGVRLASCPTEVPARSAKELQKAGSAEGARKPSGPICSEAAFQNLPCQTCSLHLFFTESHERFSPSGF